MTLVVSVNGPESVWLLADRRLSYGDSRPPKEDGRKLMFLETTDGVAILGYAGLGATSLGNEPADWMSAVLRGRNVSLEQSLGVLADAAKSQIPKHLIRVRGPGAPAHTIIGTAFVEDEPRLYTIDLVFKPDRKDYLFRYTRHVSETPTDRIPRAQRIGLCGSGAPFLFRDKRWMRDLLRVVRAHDRRQVSEKAVSDFLAGINDDVHHGVDDESVGPRCIVAWRFRKGGAHEGGGRPSMLYRCVERIRCSSSTNNFSRNGYQSSGRNDDAALQKADGGDDRG